MSGVLGQVLSRFDLVAESVKREYYWQMDFCQRGPLGVPRVDIRSLPTALF